MGEFHPLGRVHGAGQHPVTDDVRTAMVEQAAVQRFQHVRHGTGLVSKLGLEALEHSIRHRGPKRGPTADSRKPIAQARHRGLGRFARPQGGNQTTELANATKRRQVVAQSAADRHTVALQKCPHRGQLLVGPTENCELVPVRLWIKTAQAFDLRRLRH